ncbi:cyclin-dependent kinase C-1-like isoform X3 [Magnolia sinica]|uniref:cyclin-dependent kinase C-1-like isoform X3 n=1 Tax=Magnolia sinica TaxID=86752 RepID=UPI002657B6F8|nr:cyclin-dependent kinase C-1-like isoform X3 [Magnolia sinica]
MMDAADLGKHNLDEWPPKICRSINCFKILYEIGEGAYGTVYKAEDIKTGEVVALKEIKKKCLEKGIWPEELNAKRETGILSRLKHENVIHLKEIVTSEGGSMWPAVYNQFNGNIYLVLEYVDHDLEDLLNCSDVQFKVPHVKCYMKQLLEGLCYCHNNQVLHCDIKGGNILINDEGILRLADFGLACQLTDRGYSGPVSSSTQKNKNLTHAVICLWHRPPELLLQTKEQCDYGPAIDIWSVGCVFARLHGKQVMQGKDEADQILKIYELCGSATEDNWPGVSKLPNYYKFNPQSPMERCIGEFFKDLEPVALALLDKMLTLNPFERISAKDALKEAYFLTAPLPSDPKSLPKYKSSHGPLPACSTRSNLPSGQPQGPSVGATKDPQNKDSNDGGQHLVHGANAPNNQCQVTRDNILMILTAAEMLADQDSTGGESHLHHGVQGRGRPCTSHAARSTQDVETGAISDVYGANAQNKMATPQPLQGVQGRGSPCTSHAARSTQGVKTGAISDVYGANAQNKMATPQPSQHQRKHIHSGQMHSELGARPNQPKDKSQHSSATGSSHASKFVKTYQRKKVCEETTSEQIEQSTNDQGVE